MRTRTLVVFFLLCGTGVTAGEPTRLNIAQTLVELPALTLYVNVLDENDKPLSALARPDFQIRIEGKPLTIDALTPFSTTLAPVAYFFMVDISKSMTEADFELIHAGLRRWVDLLGPNDHAALFTMGESIELVSSYGASRYELIQHIEELMPRSEQTRLNDGISRALELNRGKEPNIPSRRAIVVLSDGKDEGSRLTAADVVDRLDKQSVPIYAIGFSRLKFQKQEHLNLLKHYANKSGGLYFPAEETSLEGTYAAVADATTRVWTIEANCPDCTMDGQYHEVAVFLANLEDRREVLFQPSRPTQVPVGSRLTPLLLILAGVILLGVIALFMQRARRKTISEPGLVEPPIVELAQEEPPQTGQPLVQCPSIRFLLRRVRGHELAQETWVLGHRLILGRNAQCDIEVRGERVSARHCQLSIVGKHILISDLNSTNGTILNGIPLQGSARLDNGDLIQMGDNEYRFYLAGEAT